MTEEFQRTKIERNGKSYDAIEVTDKRGRKIIVRRMSVVERFRFKKIIPVGVGEVMYWFADAMTAAAVHSIDDLVMPIVTDEAGVERAMERLDDDGMAAISPAVLALNDPALTPAEVDTAKNSPGTPSSTQPSGS